MVHAPNSNPKKNGSCSPMFFQGSQVSDLIIHEQSFTCAGEKHLPRDVQRLSPALTDAGSKIQFLFSLGVCEIRVTEKEGGSMIQCQRLQSNQLLHRRAGNSSRHFLLRKSARRVVDDLIRKVSWLLSFVLK